MSNFLKKIKKDFPNHKFEVKNKIVEKSSTLFIDGEKTGIDLLKEEDGNYKIIKTSIKYILGDIK